MTRMKPAPEGEPFTKFDNLFRAIVSAPKAAVEAEETKERARNQKKRQRQRAAPKKL
jgi:hypothetical protein